MRNCTKCNENKPVDHFWLDRGKPASQCIDCMKPYHKSKYQKNKEKIRWSGILRRYNVTKDQWEAQFAKQGSCCAICKRTSVGKGGWHTDHDHSNGRFRGIVCLLCNRLLGAAKDNVITIKEAISYLERYRADT